MFFTLHRNNAHKFFHRKKFIYVKVIKLLTILTKIFSFLPPLHLLSFFVLTEDAANELKKLLQGLNYIIEESGSEASLHARKWINQIKSTVQAKKKERKIPFIEFVSINPEFLQAGNETAAELLYKQIRTECRRPLVSSNIVFANIDEIRLLTTAVSFFFLILSTFFLSSFEHIKMLTCPQETHILLCSCH